MPSDAGKSREAVDDAPDRIAIAGEPSGIAVTAREHFRHYPVRNTIFVAIGVDAPILARGAVGPARRYASGSRRGVRTDFFRNVELLNFFDCAGGARR